MILFTKVGRSDSTETIGTGGIIRSVLNQAGNEIQIQDSNPILII